MLQSLLLSLFALGIGLVLLIWGYRAFLVTIPTFGFSHTVSAILGTGFLANVTALDVVIVGGLVFAVLSYLLLLHWCRLRLGSNRLWIRRGFNAGNQG